MCEHIINKVTVSSDKKNKIYSRYCYHMFCEFFVKEKRKSGNLRLNKNKLKENNCRLDVLKK